MAQQIDEMASKLERSKNWIVKQALIAWIDQESMREKLTYEAMADVDAGHIVSHDDIQAWATSLSSNTPLPKPI
jgi:predicted transcriptional regulator